LSDAINGVGCWNGTDFGLGTRTRREHLQSGLVGGQDYAEYDLSVDITE
jgi:hypothetical protein